MLAVDDVTMYRLVRGSRRFERYVPWYARCKQSSNFLLGLYERVSSKRLKPVNQRYSHTQEHLNPQLHSCESLTPRMVLYLYTVNQLVFVMDTG
jgi:hypothetical protein